MGSKKNAKRKKGSGAAADGPAPQKRDVRADGASPPKVADRNDRSARGRVAPPRDADSWTGAFAFDRAALSSRRFVGGAVGVLLATLLVVAIGAAPGMIFRAQHERARELGRTGDLNAALDLYAKLEEKRPDNPSLPFERANLLLAEARELLASAAGDRSPWQLVADDNNREGLRQLLFAADEAFLRVIQMQGYHREAAAGRAEGSLMLGLTTIPDDMFRLLRRYDPRWERGRGLEGRLAMRLGDWQRAATLYAPLRTSAIWGGEAQAALARAEREFAAND